jgi:hypothetical protein
LRPAAGQAGARDAVPLFGSHQSNWVPHTSDCSMGCAQTGMSIEALDVRAFVDDLNSGAG